MSRGFTSAQNTILATNAIIVENLLQIQYNGSDVFLTSAPHDTSATTTTSGGAQTFIENHTWAGFSEINDQVFASENRIAIYFEGDMTATFGSFSTAPIDFVNSDTRFIIHKLFRNASDNSIVSADPILIYDGNLVKKTYTVGGDIERLQLDCVTIPKSYAVFPILTLSGLGAI